MEFTVSVIIPVYNAEAFLEKAIKSALQQPEVLEVIVVNDGSTDGSLEITEGLKQKDTRVKIYHHKNYTNKGRSASRNLGIEKANANYIAFLDADDYYLENRFVEDKKVFEQHEEAEGVYNAIGVDFYRTFSEDEMKELQLYTLTKVIPADKLFNALMSGDYGHFSIDGLTVKKSIFKKVGCFQENLEVAEDTDLIWKMALVCKLYSGILSKPVAKRGVHTQNVFNNKDLYVIYDLKLYESLFSWSVKNKMNIKINERFLERIWILKYRQTKSVIKHLFYYFRLNLKQPKLFFTYLGVKYFPLIRFRNKYFSKHS